MVLKSLVNFNIEKGRDAFHLNKKLVFPPNIQLNIRENKSEPQWRVSDKCPCHLPVWGSKNEGGSFMVFYLLFVARSGIQQCLKLSYFFFKWATSGEFYGFSRQVMLCNANPVLSQLKKESHTI